MSMNLMNAAVEGSDDDSSSNDAPEEVAAADATDAVADRPLVAEREEAAVSQQLPADIEITPKKRTRKLAQESCGPKPTPPSKQRRVGAMQDESKKLKKTPAKGKLDMPKDRLLHCVFEGKTCIPLWPQYDMYSEDKTTYVKVGSREAWLIQFANLRRKAYREGLSATDVATMQSAKESNSTFCKKIILEFRKVVMDAKATHKKTFSSAFPSELALKFNGCEIFARSSTRQMHIRADDALLTWLRAGFQQALVTHFKAEFEAMTASSQLIACGEGNVFNYTGQGVGVRDKIFWIPSKRMWALSVKKEKEPIEKYLKDNNLCLKVKASAEGEEYVKLRHQALLDACVAWNELDNSARYRIKLPEATESCPSLQLAKKDESDASAEEDSEGESEAEDED